MSPSIVDLISDKQVFRGFFGDSLESWSPWRAALHALYGLPILQKHYPLIRQTTGRDPGMLPTGKGFQTALFLTGRRSGKSRIAAVIAAYEALFAGHEKRLSKGEQGLVACISPTRRQSSIVKSYIRSIFELPLLKPLLVAETREGFELQNGLHIQILTGDWKTARGFTICGCVIDELCFFQVDDECKLNDVELIRAIRPSMSSVPGAKLIAISSPYARRGWGYEQYERHFGNNRSKTLVWNCSSQTMNSTLSEDVIAEAYQEDPAAARSEYGGLWRDDVCGFLPRDQIILCVVSGRDYISPVIANGSTVAYSTRYTAFCDLSGGRSDAASLAIAHKEDRKVIVDLVKHYKAPFVPEFVIEQMADELKRYKIHKVYGDNYAAEFVVQSFKRHRITFERCEKNKSDLFLDLLPRLTSQQIELPDNETLIKELSSLERRTRSGGRDSVDHPRNGHDDLANSVAGVSFQITKAKKAVGLF